ncbi:hypothetical protein DV736_g660, partial [Chaetothyriales sp. CBS 134916]
MTVAVGMSSFFGGATLCILNSVAAELHMTSTEVTWLNAAQNLAAGTLLLFFGRIADLFGRRLLLIYSMGLYTICMVAAGFATNAVYIDVFSGLIGICCAASFPPAIGKLGAVYEKPSWRKNRAFACFSAGYPTGFVLGAFLAGVATQVASWRATFWVIAVIYGFFTLAAWWTVPPDNEQRLGGFNLETLAQFDFLGAFLAIAGLAALTAALTLGGDSPKGWKTPYVPALLAIGLVFIPACLWWQHVCKHPLMPLYVWRDKNFTLLVVALCLGFYGFCGNLFWISLVWQRINKDSPLFVAIKLLPAAIGGISVNITAALIMHRISNKLLMFIAATGLVIASALWSALGPSLSYFDLSFPALIFSVIGMYIMSRMSSDKQSVAGGLFNTVSRLIAAVGLGVQTSVFNAAGGASEGPDSLKYRPYQATFWVSLVGAVLVHPAFRQPHTSVSSSYSADLPPTLARAAMKEGSIRDDPPAEATPKADVSPVSSRGSSINLDASDTSLISPVDSSFTIPPRTPQALQARQPYQHDEHPPGSQIAQTTGFADETTVNTEMPVPGREKKQNTKWNRYTGEQTSLASGLPSHAPKPGSLQSLETQYPQLKDRTRQILAGLRERDAAKKAAWGRPPPPVAADSMDQPAQRVPWRGASGRTTLVDPVQNTPAARTGPLRSAHGTDSQGNHARPAAEAAHVHSSSLQTQAQPPVRPTELGSSRSSSPDKVQPSLHSAASDESIKPVAPLKPRIPSVTSSIDEQSTNAHAQQASVPQGGRRVPKLQKPLRPKFSFEPDSAPETPTAIIPRKAVNPKAQNATVAQLQHEQESKQSWATYTTTEVDDSPKSLAPMMMATPPTSPFRALPSPVVVRKRMADTGQGRGPYSSAGLNHSSASIVSRKPVASDQHRSVSLAASNAAFKSLPPTPVELQAGDKISSLEARLDDLARRRRNNTKINRELTANLARNAITYDMRKRKEVEKLIANLGLELDEIGREEHEVALILHRARKKRDRDTFYENPTGLWIRRITS